MLAISVQEAWVIASMRKVLPGEKQVFKMFFSFFLEQTPHPQFPCNEWGIHASESLLLNCCFLTELKKMDPGDQLVNSKGLKHVNLWSNYQSLS